MGITITEQIHDRVVTFLEDVGVVSPEVTVKPVYRKSRSSTHLIDHGGYVITIHTLYEKGSRAHIFRASGRFSIPFGSIESVAQRYVHERTVEVFNDLVRNENAAVANSVREYFASRHPGYHWTRLVRNRSKVKDPLYKSVTPSANPQKPVEVCVGNLILTVSQAERVADLLLTFRREDEGAQ